MKATSHVDELPELISLQRACRRADISNELAMNLAPD